MPTFAELGIPFPLFEAPTSAAPDYAQGATCLFCGERDRHCFRLNVHGDVMLPCPSCLVESGLSASRRIDTPCWSCGAIIPFPYPRGKPILICYQCLRAGKGTISKDTELGLVSWVEAVEGLTYGAPGVKTDQFELVPSDSQEGWCRARIPPEHFDELLRTPSFVTWQGDRWLFCCKRPMTYLGEWADVMASPLRPRDPRAVLYGALEEDEPTKGSIWEALSEGGSCLCVYVFHCKSCSRFRATWDND